MNVTNIDLFEAARSGQLDKIPGITAEYLATVTNGYGHTPLHSAAARTSRCSSRTSRCS